MGGYLPYRARIKINSAMEMKSNTCTSRRNQACVVYSFMNCFYLDHTHSSL